ncbi:MAG TPA: thioredoxin domain-containing protein, partial [Rhodoglobus sp.]|nr:thioredoxin domain-containing protein [Rhodoglobus sp.]
GGGDPVLAAQGLAGDPERSDSALPSGWSALAAASLRLFELTGERRYHDAASEAMSAVAADAAATPIAFGAALGVMRGLDGTSRELVVVDADEGLATVARRAGGILVTASQARALADAGFALFADRTGPAAYLCEGLVCRLPVRTAAELQELLATA